MRVFAVVHVRTSEKTLDLCVPYAPAPGVRQHDEVDQAHDLLEQKALDRGGDQGRRQVEEPRGDTPGPHGELSVQVAVEEQTLDMAETSKALFQD